MTNASLRERFGVIERSRSTVSQLIRKAVEAGAIVSLDAEAPPKLMRYLPFLGRWFTGEETLSEVLDGCSLYVRIAV